MPRPDYGHLPAFNQTRLTLTARSAAQFIAVLMPIALASLAATLQPANAWEIREHLLRDTRAGAMAWHDNDRWGACFDLPTRGLHDFSGIGSQLVSGFSNRFFPGADPFPCNEKQNRFYQAVVNFDLSGIRPVSVVSARLEFQGEELDFRAAPSPRGQTCFFRIVRAGEGWRTGNRRTTSESGMIDAAGPLTVFNVPRPSGSRFQRLVVDVTRQVARDVNNPASLQQGYVIEPSLNRMDRDENASCVRAFNQFRLRIRTLEF